MKSGSRGLLWIYALFCLFVIYFLGDKLYRMHVDKTIYWISSDGSQYLKNLQDFEGISFAQVPSLFLTAMPIFLIRIFGNSFKILFLFNLLVLTYSLWSTSSLFRSATYRNAFLFLALVFPYTLFSPFSVNKEVFMVSSCLMFITYWVRGRFIDLLLSLVFAFLARYYMVGALLFLWVAFPRVYSPRIWIVLSTLILCSLGLYFKHFVPGYSPGDADYYAEAGRISSFFNYCVDNGMYWVIYIPKFIILMMSKTWSLLLTSDFMDRKFDVAEGFVSVMSLIVFLGAFLMLLLRKVSRPFGYLFFMGLVAPLPLMWTEIFHWRYFSYVYFIFLFAIMKELDVLYSVLVSRNEYGVEIHER